MRHILFILVTLVLSTSLSFGQSQDHKEITLENIWKDYTFYAYSVPGFNFLNDGQHFTRQVKDTIKSYDLTSGAFKENIAIFPNMQSYSFSKDESKILISTDSESIYRRSSKGIYHVLDRTTGEIQQVYDAGSISNPKFSPDASKIAFTYANNLYIKHLSSKKIEQVTSDGKFNEIINGMADWVYEEEFSFTRAFYWNEQGTQIAYLKFDESKVKEFTMTNYRNGMYPEYQTFKYPKVGEDNSIISVHVYHLNTKKNQQIALQSDVEYVPRLTWTKNENELIVYTLNRHQNDLKLHVVNSATFKSRLLLRETSEQYVDIHDNMTFTKDGKKFFWTSEKDGYNHIYLYDLNGKELAQLTKGKYDVTSFYGYDEKRNRVYFQAARKNPMNREIYSTNMYGKKWKVIADADGTNSAQFSKTFDYYTLNHSTINSPASYTVYTSKGKKLRTIVDNKHIKQLKGAYGITSVDFFEVPTKDNVMLNGYMMKPPNFDASKKYPMLMFVYGGPGSQTVQNRWGGFNFWWFQYLAQKGYIVVSVDNRGTGARGAAFKKMTYMQLGKYEIIDQIEAAKHLGKKDYIDANRIGMFGWSYGGYMSSLAITKGADVFKATIAVAPVTNWKWYDTVYTERYMRTAKENTDGYEQNSPVNFAHLMKGKYLLVHGMGDDNVHFQHTAEMANALVKANKQFDTYFYPNRNHGIYGGNTRLHLYTKMSNFILNNL